MGSSGDNTNVCGLSCEPGWQWDPINLRCDQCTFALPSQALWSNECNWTCNAGFYKFQQMCVTCSELATMSGYHQSAHGAWANNGSNCLLNCNSPYVSTPATAVQGGYVCC